jgi:hypothetical protein
LYVGDWGGGHPVDYILDAFALPVAAGDYLETGRVQGAGLDKVIVDYDVKFQPDHVS